MGKSSINGPFSMAMSNNQMVICGCLWNCHSKKHQKDEFLPVQLGMLSGSIILKIGINKSQYCEPLTYPLVSSNLAARWWIFQQAMFDCGRVPKKHEMPRCLVLFDTLIFSLWIHWYLDF